MLLIKVTLCTTEDKWYVKNDIKHSLILEDNIVFSLSFVIIYGNLLKYIAGTSQSVK